MKMDELIELYIESKRGSWSDTTLKNEGYRLAGVTKEMLTKPELLWAHFTKTRKLKPYSAKIALTRAGEVLDFAMREGHIDLRTNALKDWMSANQRKFKDAYQKKVVDVTFEEAVQRISKIKDEEVRAKAEQLLITGMRYLESTTLTKSGEIVGKGGTKRTVHSGKDVQVVFGRGYHTFLRHLKAVGLTPHMLRKIAATEAASEGHSITTLMDMFGWKSHQMPALYVQSHETKKLANHLLTKVRGKGTKHGK